MLKWVGIAFGGLVGVLVLFFIGGSRVTKTYDVTVAGVTVPTDAGTPVRGEHIVRSYGLCVECHGLKLEGELLDEDPVFGRIAPSNLTSGLGGVGGDYADAAGSARFGTVLGTTGNRWWSCRRSTLTSSAIRISAISSPT